MDVLVRAFNVLVGPYRSEVSEVFEQGRGPDIAYAERLDFRTWAERGYLMPLDDCVAQEEEFSRLRPEYWEMVRWQGHIWAVPFNIGVNMLYFNKHLLRELGWSAEQIDDLPRRIQMGDFALADLVATAQLAVDMGVVEPGYGFWPFYNHYQTIWLTYMAFGGKIFDDEQQKMAIRQDVLAEVYAFYAAAARARLTPKEFRSFINGGVWPNGAIWRDTVAHGRVLFWQDTNNSWGDYVEATRASGGEERLQETIGFALFPSGGRGQPGHTQIHSLGSFVVAAEAGSGRQQQRVACSLLAKMFSPEIVALNMQKARLLSGLVERPGEEEVNRDSFSKATAYLLEHPGYPRNLDQMVVNDRHLLFPFLVRVEAGELTPAAGASLAVQSLQSQFGDAVIVR